MVESLTYSPGLGKSDHSCLSFNYNCYIDNKPCAYTKFNFYKGNYKEIEESLTTQQLQNILQGLSLNDSWNCYAEKTTQLIKEHIR